MSFIALVSCRSNSNEEEKNEQLTADNDSIEVQGHRGDRGNYPENSIPGFISAVDKGADVIELDVVISKDNKVVVSHEPFMSSLYMLTPKGDSINKEMERSYNFYEMTYDSIRQFDAGSKGNVRFPDQKKMKTYKPLLSEVIDTVEAYIAANDLPGVKYNVELKSSEDLYGVFQPKPEEFVDLVMGVISEKGMEENINIQSFDVNILNALHKNYPNIEVGYLVWQEGIEMNLSRLNFEPEIYSPHYGLVKNEAFVDSVTSMGMKLIPWTVNNTEDIERMIQLGVDGIITDYPERVLSRI